MWSLAGLIYPRAPTATQPGGVAVQEVANKRLEAKWESVAHERVSKSRWAEKNILE